MIDSLSHTNWWNSNRLQTITDAAPSTYKDYGFKQNGTEEYQYDANGNLIFDPHKDMDVVYNFLNLPERIEFADCKTIEFTYDAGGNKLKKELKNGTMLLATHDYLGSIEYKGSELEAIYHDEGRVYYEEGTGRYEFNIQDHLGNTRLTFTDKDNDDIIEVTSNPQTNEILQENHYYPFGMNMNGQWMANPGREDKYKFNSIERNDDFGLNADMAYFRTLDGAIGRWWQIDPLAEIAHGWTPYRFGFNTPLYYSDPWGLFEDKKDAKEYAKEKGIRTGLFSNNKIRKQSDGTYAIENEKEHTSIANDPEFGIMTALLITDEKSDQSGFLESSGTYAAAASSLLTTAGELQHSGSFGLDVWRGQNGKFYSMSPAPGKTRSFYGNQYTGSVNKAKAIARPIKFAGTALGFYNYASIGSSYINGNLSDVQLVGETTANTVTTFGGIYGVSFGIGWEGGRAITKTQGYQNWKRDKWLPFREKHFGY